jgi:single-strand DNA-binding protein
MRTVNKVILIWNVTKDPFVKTTDNGKKVALFTIATNRYFKNLKWEVKTEAEFTNCIAWWSLAERCEQSLKKGKLVYAEWRLKTKTIEREDGVKFFKTEIVIVNLIFLNKRSDFDEQESPITPEIDVIADDTELDIDDKF